MFSLKFIPIFLVLAKSEGFFLTKHYEEDNYFCVTNNSNALSWVIDKIEEQFDIKSNYIPEFPSAFTLKISNAFKINQYLTNSPWSIKNSLDFNFGPIFDERWEDLPAFKSNFLPSDNRRDSLEFTKVIEISKENFEIPISIRIEEQGHIFLCNGQSVTSRCYWLLLQVKFKEEKASAIRKCDQGKIPTKNYVYPESPCSNRRFEIRHPDFPEFFTNKQWRHFLLEKQQNTITFSRTLHNKKEKIIEWKDDENPVKVNNIFIHSKNVNGLWKFHNYYFLYTNQESNDVNFNGLIYPYQNSICISMYISMCSSCKLKLSLSNQKIIRGEETFESKHSGWMKIRFLVENITNYNGHNLLISTIGQKSDSFWAIDKIRQCQIEEYRYIGLTEKAKCQLISDHDEISEISSLTEYVDNACPENTIGDFCMKCDMLYKENCNKVTICNKEKCSCSSGYYGSDCYYSCASGTYGHGCKKKCGKCSHDCNFIDGICTYNSCVENFTGLKCDIPPAIVFANPPDVVDVGFTEAKVVVSNFQIERGLSVEEPQSYTIRHKKSDESVQNWIFSKESKVFNNTGKFKLSNLKPETEYLVQGIIVTSSWQIGDYLKTQKFVTKCQEISESNIEIQATNTTALITITRDSEFVCKSYIVSIYETKPGIFIDNGTFFSDLSPYTEYTVKIFGKNNLVKTFKTSEGVPSQVLGLNEVTKSSSSVQLQWIKPAQINGFFEHYVIEYQHISYNGCNKPINKPSAINRLTTIQASIIINNIMSYSSYQIWVFAKNSKFYGNKTSLIITTEALEHILPEEIPEVVNIETSHYGATIDLSEISCENKHGTLVAKITTICASDWCQNQNRNPRVLDTKTISLNQLESFSEYNVELTFCRKNGTCAEIIHRKICTKPTVPRKVNNLSVYTKNETTISLRWKPPYPPTGILKNYKITYSYYYWKSYNEQKLFGIIPCKLWSDFHCVTLDSLQTKTRYKIEVSARNEKPDDFGEALAIFDTTETTNSEKPYDLKAAWSLENNLVVEWKHPNKSNGNINSFVIYLRSQMGKIIEKKLLVSADSYNLTYFYQVNSSEFFPTNLYRVSVYADNGYIGDSATVDIESPPDIPYLLSDPKIETLNTSIIISLAPKQIRGQSDKYRIIVLRSGQNPQTVNYPELQKFNLGNLKLILVCNISEANLNLGIGTSQESENCQEFDNSMLEPCDSYNITLILVNSYKNQSRETIYSLKVSTIGGILETDSSLFGLFALLLLIPLIAILYLKRDKFVHIKNRLLAANPHASTEVLEIQDDQIPLSKVANKKVAKAPSTTNNVEIYSKLIKITDFEEYVKESIQNGELERQHSLFPRGATKPWYYGSLPENKAKNRYNNLIAYDHTRVILQTSGNTSHSDYINANYINGYKIPKAYIATQGPKASTLGDFWRMIWQENVRHIAMLANLLEGGKKKSREILA